nr:MAG TPA_asm: hypothetical protein [Caudoviricetes sp.]
MEGADLQRRCLPLPMGCNHSGLRIHRRLTPETHQ